MKEESVVAAILTVAFYTGRGGAMGLPQVLATYQEVLSQIGARKAPAKKRRLRR